MISEAVMNMPISRDGAEIAAVRRGDPEALSALIEQFHHRLYRYLLHVCKDSFTAEDLLQQTWLRVIEKVHKYDSRRRFDVWLFSVARNLAIDHFRARKFADSLDEPASTEGLTWSEKLPGADAGALERLLLAEQNVFLGECLNQLPAIHREVLALRFEEDLKLDEIAALAGIPLSTVKSRLSRAMDGLRARVEERLRGTEL
jgi:RNA polymerase sigma-70 factor (ECF subfamily)